MYKICLREIFILQMKRQRGCAENGVQILPLRLHVEENPAFEKKKTSHQYVQKRMKPEAD